MNISVLVLLLPFLTFIFLAFFGKKTFRKKGRNHWKPFHRYHHLGSRHNDF